MQVLYFQRQAPQQPMSQTLTRLQHDVKSVFQDPSLRVLTIFVTNICNAKCGTCFYWQNLNTPTDALSLDEYQKIAEATPPLEHLLFSGGEPTLCRDIGKIASYFIKSPHQTLTMPTNGIILKRTMDVAEEFAERFPENRITIGVSFDGFAETHDKVRGVPKNFEKSMASLRELCKLRDKHPNMRITTLTCFFKQNAPEVPDLIRFFDQETEVDFVTVEPMRGQRKDMDLAAPKPEEVRAIQNLAGEINERRLLERHPDEVTSMMSHLKELWNTQQEFYDTRKLNTTCRAGEVTAVLEVNGEIRACELLGLVGSVREHNYSIPAVLAAKKAEDERKMIVSGACACTHCVNIGHSLAFDKKAAARRVLRQKYMAWQLFHSPF